MKMSRERGSECFCACDTFVWLTKHVNFWTIHTAWQCYVWRCIRWLWCIRWLCVQYSHKTRSDYCFFGKCPRQLWKLLQKMKENIVRSAFNLFEKLKNVSFVSRRVAFTVDFCELLLRMWQVCGWHRQVCCLLWNRMLLTELPSPYRHQ